jgi:uncharacterized protein YjiS (DUF1127 family)
LSQGLETAILLVEQEISPLVSRRWKMASPDDYLCLPTSGPCARAELRSLDFHRFDFRSADFRGLMTWLLDIQAGWAERNRQRRTLAALDDRMLKDIGLDRAAVSREEAKLFWRP